VASEWRDAARGAIRGERALLDRVMDGLLLL
jgi:hypothetical protein